MKEHNLARQRLALGQVAGQPAARNMREMVWDEELASIAQRWADQCTPQHDLRRNVGKRLRLFFKIFLSFYYIERFAVGQNVAHTWTYQKMPPNKDSPEFKRHVSGWFNEVKLD